MKLKLNRLVLAVAAMAAFLLPVSAYAQTYRSQHDVATTSGAVLTVGNVGGWSASFEEKPAGSPATVSVTIQPCMRGGTCDAVASTNTSTSATTITLTFTKVYDYFKVVPTWTGGTNATFEVNSTVTISRNPSNGGAVASVFGRTGTVLAVSGDYTCLQVTNCTPIPTLAQGAPVSSSNTSIAASGAYQFADQDTGYTSASDPCLAVTHAASRLTVANFGTVDARGLITTDGKNLLPCPVASANTMVASTSGLTVLWGNYTVWLPMSEAAAGTALLPPQGTVPLPTKSGYFFGSGRGDQNTTNGTTFAFCTGTNTPRAGCIAPATRHWTVSTTTITRAGNRTYLGVNATGMDLVAGEPVRLNGSTTTTNDTAGRVCNLNVANATRTDASCPANPTSSLVYVVVPSGIVSIITATAGSAQTPGTYKIAGVGGSCTQAPAIQVVVQAGGTVTTSPQVLNPGVGCVTAPTFTLAAGGTPATFTPALETACAASCGVIHGEIPMFDTTPLAGNQFAQRLENMAIDCEGVQDAVGLRSLSGNEQFQVRHVKISGCPERDIDGHTFALQNASTFEDLELYAGTTCGVNCDSTTSAAFFGDSGPHGWRDVTMNFSNLTHTGLMGVIVDTGVFPIGMQGDHCENIQKCHVFGLDAPAQAIRYTDDTGGPNTACVDAGCVPSDGPFQNATSSNFTIFNEFPTGNPQTQDWLIENAIKNSGQQFIIEDFVNATSGTNDHSSNNNSLELYAADNGCITTTDNIIPSKFCNGLIANYQPFPDYAPVGGGTAQAQTATMNPPAISLTAGLMVRWLPIAANSAAAPTLAINGLTAKTITKCGTAALVANDLLTGVIAYAHYDGTQFQLINPQTGSCGQPFSGGVATDSGAANAYVINPSPPVTLATGALVILHPANASSGASTINVSGTGAKAITKNGTVALGADLIITNYYLLMYDGTEWIVWGNALGCNTCTRTAGTPVNHQIGIWASANTIGNTSTTMQADATNSFMANYNSEALAGFGQPYFRGVTTQKAETAADASVLSVTPAAAVGSYRACFNLSVSAAAAATLGWTATWTDSNGNAQTPVNMPLFQTGVAAPALTFTTSVAANYYNCANFDVNNAGTAIVVKLTFAGTSFTAKATATVERIN